MDPDHTQRLVGPDLGLNKGYKQMTLIGKEVT